MALIETMPTFMGQQLYPGGLPLNANSVTVNERTINEIYLDTCDGDFGEDHPDVCILNDFIRYYLLAPCWELGRIKKQEIMSANSDELFELCMDLGLDPL